MGCIHDPIDFTLLFFDIGSPVIYQQGQQEHNLKVLSCKDPMRYWARDHLNYPGNIVIDPYILSLLFEAILIEP